MEIRDQRAASVLARQHNPVERMRLQGIAHLGKVSRVPGWLDLDCRCFQ
jgi:hypothetical protein